MVSTVATHTGGNVTVISTVDEAKPSWYISGTEEGNEVPSAN